MCYFIDMSTYKIKSLQASPDHLMDHLVQEHSAVDPTFVEDFLLCYRIFLKSPMELAYRLQTWFNTSTLRNKVSIHLVRCCYKQNIVSTLIFVKLEEICRCWLHLILPKYWVVTTESIVSTMIWWSWREAFIAHYQC